MLPGREMYTFLLVLPLLLSLSELHPSLASADVVGTAAANSSSATSSSACSRTALSECDRSKCTLFKSSHLVDKFCAFQGVTATLLAFEPDPLWNTRLQEFELCTGASVTLVYVGGGETHMQAALQADVGFDEHESALVESSGAGIYDAYVVQPTWLPGVNNGLENLSPRIASTAVVNWLDINDMSRKIVSFNGSVRALPLDIDYIALGWRKDVFDAHNKTPPDTLEELVELAEYFNGRDHTGDGEPDWGFCITPQVNYFMAFVAPILQTMQRQCRQEKGRTVCDGPHTGQNLFFDVSTFEPLLDNPGVHYAVELYRRFLLASNCQDQLKPEGSNKYALGKCDRQAAMQTGKCAGVVSMPGTLTNLLKPWNQTGSLGPKPRYDEARKIVWEVETQDGSHWGRRAVFPGSTKVWDRHANVVRACDPALCPKAQNRSGRLVNYAPFFSEGGEAYAIRASAPKVKKDALWVLFAWFSNLSFSDVPLTGLYRESQLESLSSGSPDDFLKPAWQRQMDEDLARVLSFYFADPVRGTSEGVLGNGAMDLILLGFSEYMDRLHQHINEEFLIHPRVFFGLADPAEFPEQLYRASLQNLVQAYQSLTEKYGRLQQIARWRSSLGMPSLPMSEICSRLEPGYAECREFTETPLVNLLLPLGLVAVAAVLLLLGLCVQNVLSQLRTKRGLEIKRRQQYQDIVESSEESLDQLGYPMVVMKARDFLAMGKLMPYEQLRNEGKLVFLDSLEYALEFKRDKFIVFMSHQWLGWVAPDPISLHYATMCGAIRDVLGRVGVTSLLNAGDAQAPVGKVTFENLYIWCDYVSIAQDHRPTQMMAVDSLPIYSSIADVFIIVAPPAQHADTGLPCDIDTYNMRGWCRAEMWSKVCGTGLAQMYLAGSADGTLEPVTEAWLQRLDFRIFHGDFSCCRFGHKGSHACDKENLVKPALGLYSLMLRQRNSKNIQPLLELIEASKAEFFPSEFVFRNCKGAQESRELFGPLVGLMEEHALTNVTASSSMRSRALAESSRLRDLSSQCAHSEANLIPQLSPTAASYNGSDSSPGSIAPESPLSETPCNESTCMSVTGEHVTSPRECFG